MGHSRTPTSYYMLKVKIGRCCDPGGRAPWPRHRRHTWREHHARTGRLTIKLFLHPVLGKKVNAYIIIIIINELFFFPVFFYYFKTVVDGSPGAKAGVKKGEYVNNCPAMPPLWDVPLSAAFSSINAQWLCCASTPKILNDDLYGQSILH